MRGLAERQSAESTDGLRIGHSGDHALFERWGRAIVATVANHENVGIDDELLEVGLRVLPNTLGLLRVLDAPQRADHGRHLTDLEDARRNATAAMQVAIRLAHQRQQHAVCRSRRRKLLGLQELPSRALSPAGDRNRDSKTDHVILFTAAAHAAFTPSKTAAPSSCSLRLSEILPPTSNSFASMSPPFAFRTISRAWISLPSMPNQIGRASCRERG